MPDQFRADCEDLIEVAHNQLNPLSDDVEVSAKTIHGLSTSTTTWGVGPWSAVVIDMVYEDVRGTFERLQKDIAEYVDDVAVALRAVAENYLRVDEEIS